MHEPHVTAGTTVYDAAGKKVGTLNAYNPQNGYLAVRTGWLIRKDLYIHRRAVSCSDATSISLQLSKDDLKAAHYDFPWPQGDDPLIAAAQSAPPVSSVTGTGDGGQSETTAETTPAATPATPPRAPVSRFASLDG